MDTVEKMKLIAKLMFEDGFEARSLTINEAAAEITRLRKQNAEMHDECVSGMNEITILRAENAALRALLAEAEAAKADAWDEGYNSGRLDEMTDERMRSNPYRSKTDAN